MTGPEGPEQPNGSRPQPAAGPPLGSIFTLAGRPAPALYAGAWLLALVGAALLGVAFAAAGSGNAGGATLLATTAFLTFFLSGVMASGYQAISRRMSRPADRYRGPSPFLVFAVVFTAANAAIGALIAAGHVDPTAATGLGALLSLAVVVPLYALSVWFLVVREGGLSWGEMGWPSGAVAWSRTFRGFVYGALLTLPVVLVTAFLAALLASFLQVSPPPMLPLPTTPSNLLLDVVVAVVLAPFGEELFFRGFAQTAWTRDLGWPAALLRSAIFFALVHAVSTGGADLSEALRLATVAAVARLPVAFALGWVFARTGSVVASMGMHATFNGLGLLLAALASSS